MFETVVIPTLYWPAREEYVSPVAKNLKQQNGND
jgi:hypothetical protein